jgi:hypothetical protein
MRLWQNGTILAHGRRPPAPRRGAAALLVGLVVAGVFLNTVGNHLVWLDPTQIEARSRIYDSFAGFLSGLTRVSDNNYYRPVQNLLNTLDVLLWGTAYTGFHLTNVLLHALNAALLCLIGIELLERLKRRAALQVAAVAAVLWGVHPTKTESVAMIAGRTDLLQLLALIATVWTLRLTARSEQRAKSVVSPRHQVLAAALFLSSLLAKEAAIVFPLLICWSELVAGRFTPAVAEARRARRRALTTLVWPMACVAAGYVAARLLWLWRPVAFDVTYPASTRLLTQTVVLPGYILSLLHPLGASACDVVRLHWSVDLPVLAGAAALAGARGLGAHLFLRRREAVLVWALGWFLLALAPTFNILQQTHFRADRYLYIASFGPILLFVHGLFRAAEALRARMRHADRVLVAVLGALLLIFGIATLRRNQEWRDTSRLFQAEVERRPDYREGLYFLARTRIENGDLGPALELARRGMAIDRSRFAASIADAYFHDVLIAIKRRQGDVQGAIAMLEELIRTQPTQARWYQLLADAHRSSGREDLAEGVLGRMKANRAE